MRKALFFKIACMSMRGARSGYASSGVEAKSKWQHRVVSR